MNQVNRSLIVVKPKQPFLDWALSLEHFPEGLDLKELRDDSTAYLIPECETFEDQMDVLEWSADFIFDEELRSWYTDEDVWPVVRNPEIFLEWFDVEFHSLVFDLDEQSPLEHIDSDSNPDAPSLLDPRSNGH